MLDLLRRLRVPLLFAALVLLSALLMLGSRERAGERLQDNWADTLLLEGVAPVQKVLLWPTRQGALLWTRYVALQGVREENARLRARNLALEDANLALREDLVARGQLGRIAAMRDEHEVALLPALVVGQDISPWFRSLLLDRGRRAQVASGMPVVAPGGLVGLVSATALFSARVSMVLDRRSAVDAIVQRSRARGIVRGDGRGALRFVFARRGDDVRVGDVLITSGVSGVYPKGLRVGTVTEVQAARNEVIHSAALKPAVDAGQLEQVFVMLQRGPSMALLFGPDGDQPAPGAAER